MSDPADVPRPEDYTFMKPEGLLAHYTTASTAFEHIVPDQRLRMSPYHKMRDPVESQDILPAISWSGDPPGAERATWAVLADIKAARDAMRVLAFSGDAGDGMRLSRPTFDCSWARPRMWEQYGDNHTGACLLFDRGRLEATLMNELGEERIFSGDVTYDREGIAASPVQHVTDVTYDREGIAASPVQHVTDDRIFDEKQRQKAVADHIDRYRNDFFLLKSDDFETEAEYRVVLKTDDQPPGRLHHGRGGLRLRRLRRRARRRGGGAGLPAVAEAWSPRVVRPRRRQAAAHVVGARHSDASLDRGGVMSFTS